MILGKLRIGTKLGLVTAGLGFAVLFATYLFSDASNFEIDFAKSEIRGERYLRPLASLQVNIAAHKSITRRVFAGGTDLQSALQQRERAVDEAFSKLMDVHLELAKDLKVTKDELAVRGRASDVMPEAMLALWERAKSETSPQASSEMHLKLIADVRTLIAHIGDMSQLILDPDLDTYYAMDAFLIRMPDVVERLVKSVDPVQSILQTKRPFTVKERTQLWGELNVLQYQLDNIAYDRNATVVEAVKYSNLKEQLERELNPRATALEVAHRAIAEMSQKVVFDERAGTAPDVTPVAWANGVDNLMNSAEVYWGVLLEQMHHMLSKRIEARAASRNGKLAVVLLLVASTLVFTFLVMRSITGPIAKAKAIADQLARGELPERIDPGTAVDETGMLLRSLNDMLQFLDLRNTIRGLQQAAAVLTNAVDNFDKQTEAQSHSVTRQATALQQTQVTAQEIKQTSLMASQKAEGVIRVAERAEQVSRAGEAAVQKSLAGLNDIKAQVDTIAGKIIALSDSTMQISGITQTVKDLADQSNMLALNAAIEAVRSGEHGKGFAVVAREIRSLADQSIQATKRVREILDIVGKAIHATVDATEVGGRRIEAGLEEVKASGENLRELSSIVSESSLNVRQIAAAVGQQNAGISQIFSAVTEQSAMMDDTVQRLEAVKQTAALVREVSAKVSNVVSRYRLTDLDTAASPPTGTSPGAPRLAQAAEGAAKHFGGDNGVDHSSMVDQRSFPGDDHPLGGSKS